MNVPQINEAILLATGEHWTKVAKVIAIVGKSTGTDLASTEEGCEVISEHIQALVRSGDLVAQGDVRLCRFSEVRRAVGHESHTQTS